MPNPLLELSAAELRTIAEQVAQGRIALPFTPTSLARLVSAKKASDITAALNELLTPSGCLEALAQSRELSVPLSSQLEVVTTGAHDSGADTRRTAIVAENLFRDAQSTILVSGYNIFEGRSILATLIDRVREMPGLQVELFLNLNKPADEFLSIFKAKHWPRDLPVPPIYYHPLSLLPKGDPQKAVLHSKCVVVDSCKVFLTSANLTEAAYQRNIELGVAFSDGSTARQIEAFFSGLVEQGVLVLLD